MIGDDPQISAGPAPLDAEKLPTVLIVDDEEISRRRNSLALKMASEAIFTKRLVAANIPEALSVLSRELVHVVLLDKNLGADEKDPAQNGILSIPHFLQIQPHLQILVVTASEATGDEATAIDAGALGYINKKCSDELLVAQVKRAIGISKIAIRCSRFDRADTHSKATRFAGNSLAIRKMVSMLDMVAESDRPVLLTGENGTGKTTSASYIHERRKKYLNQEDRPFINVNIAALGADLIEGELFGYEKGAFTDAKERKLGLVELANGGTLFLDEIGEISTSIQVKLLKALDGKGSYFRVGGTKELTSSFKLIVATNQNLEQLVKDGRFREDLLMRISTLTIRVPSLAERKEDIPELIRTLLPLACKENRVQVSFDEIPLTFFEYLMNIPIQGNIRGLEHQLTRLLVYCRRDEKNKPLLRYWRSVPGFESKSVLEKMSLATESESPITYQELSNRPFGMLEGEFPGLGSLLELTRDKTIAEVATKFQKKW